VRDRGEQFFLGVSVRDADHADVIISVGDATRFGGMRVYKIVRKDGSWQIERVVEYPNGAEFSWW
jgi:hypothetical protein